MRDYLPDNWARLLVEPESVVKLLTFLHDRALSGISGYASASKLALRFDDAELSLDERLDALVKAEMVTAASVGFMTGLGGVLVLPISLPGNLAANFFLQLRMASAMAQLCGLDPAAAPARALAMVCLTGDEARAMLEKLGIQFFMLPRDEAMAKVGQAVSATLTDAVGRRVLAKLGEKGTARFGRAIPLFGGLVSAGVDAIYTRAVGKAARSIFLHVAKP